MQQVEILPILPAEHKIFAANLARKQRHPLVSGSVAIDRRQAETIKIISPQQFRADRMAAISRISTDKLAPPIIVGEFDKPQIFQPVALRFGHRENDCPRNRTVGVAAHDRRNDLLFGFMVKQRSSSEQRLRMQLQVTPFGDDCLTKCNRRNMPLTHRAQRKHDPDASLLQARLVRVTNNGRVHQRCGGVAIFMAEIGTNQLAHFRAGFGTG